MESDFVCSGWPDPGRPRQPCPKTSYARSADAMRSGLVAKARNLEARGRPRPCPPDLAADSPFHPDNTDALEGIARDYKLTGKEDKADEALLSTAPRSVPTIPTSPGSRPCRPPADDELRKAGDLRRMVSRADIAHRYSFLDPQEWGPANSHHTMQVGSIGQAAFPTLRGAWSCLSHALSCADAEGRGPACAR